MKNSPAKATAPSPHHKQRGSPPRTWVRKILPDGQVTETCPPHCADNHSNEQPGSLADLTHGFYFDGPELPVFDAKQGAVLVPILGGRIQISPYSTDRKRQMPHLVLELLQDEVMGT
ncbi:DUF6907 domain-containing protein [Streptomyces sp. NPDC126933]|uniref:DUF6907 domain-containing protein n=1 Tax=unclassified Streptomyces TaxID=2593676 RepID=UPI003656ACD6